MTAPSPEIRLVQLTMTEHEAIVLKVVATAGVGVMGLLEDVSLPEAIFAAQHNARYLVGTPLLHEAYNLLMPKLNALRGFESP
jgi:hypothetical protein